MDDARYKELTIREFTKAAEVYDGDKAGIYEMCRDDYPPILRELLDFDFEDLLDVGCGTGPMIELLASELPGKNYTGIDLTPRMIEVANRKGIDGARFVVGDAEDLPFDSESFDIVICANSFHHYPRPQCFFDEVARVLRPGGRLVLRDYTAAAPIVWLMNHIEMPLANLIGHGDVRAYTLDEVRAFCVSSGLTPITLQARKKFRLHLVAQRDLGERDVAQRDAEGRTPSVSRERDGKGPTRSANGLCAAFLSLALATNPLPSPASANKSETVHVSTDASGVVTGVTVEDVLLNAEASAKLPDRTTLADIVPSDEDLSFTTGSDGALTWEADGDDVSYEGTSTAKPPVSVRVAYTLDGAAVNPQDLAGATGHLTIRVDYENESEEVRSIDGKDERIHTPFVCLTVAILDDEVFRNVSVENGKLVDDKGGLAVIGYAAPGLRQSLDLDEDAELDIPEHLQIEADVTELVLDPIYTIVTPELFGEMDSSDLDLGDLGDFGDGTDELRDAMNKLVSGAGSLRDALRQVADGSDQLGGGARALREALNPLPDGLGQLKSGAQTLANQLGEASGVVGGLKDGATGIADATDGARQLVDAASGGMDTASSLVSDLRQRADGTGFSDARSAMDDARATTIAAGDAVTTAQGLIEGISGQVKEQRDTAATDLAAAQEALDTFLASEDVDLTEEQRAALEGAREQVSIAQAHVTAIDATLPAGIDAQVATLSDASSTLAADAERIDAASVTLAPIVADADGALEALAGASEAAGTASGALDTTTQGARNLGAGVEGVATGLSAASGGAQTLADGIGAVGDAAPQALAGVDALVQGSERLTSALDATADGSDRLASGLAAFNDEGIAELADALDDLKSDLDGTSARLDALREAAADYDTFAGKVDGQDGTVRFIYKTERIG
ncbi:MAG: methyltransferase domain-containing protein [Atopobiaceae bacterium]|nr:methyltransferase domain-containing protein [Atopobiaceae bacterium]